MRIFLAMILLVCHNIYIMNESEYNWRDDASCLNEDPDMFTLPRSLRAKKGLNAIAKKYVRLNVRSDKNV